MKTEIRINGKMKVILTPENNIEKEIFKELFSGLVKITPVLNSNGEVIIETDTDQKQK